jgi:L-lactate dehydrogenase complex protein LldG
MTSARDEILGLVRVALVNRRTRSPEPEPEPAPVPRDYHRSLAMDVDVLALFAQRAAEYRATVSRTTGTDLPTVIAERLRRRGVRTLVVPVGIPREWLAEADVETWYDEPPLSVTQLDAADGAITGAAVGIALTGTVVLDAGPDQGRRALSLLPDYHLCVVRADQIVGTVPEAIARLRPERPQTWISGPSATSDIELNRVEGVHGPRTLDLLICE